MNFRRLPPSDAITCTYQYLRHINYYNHLTLMDEWKLSASVQKPTMQRLQIWQTERPDKPEQSLKATRVCLCVTSAPCGNTAEREQDDRNQYSRCFHPRKESFKSKLTLCYLVTPLAELVHLFSHPVPVPVNRRSRKRGTKCPCSSQRSISWPGPADLPPPAGIRTTSSVKWWSSETWSSGSNESSRKVKDPFKIAPG